MGSDRRAQPDVRKLPALRERLARLHAELRLMRGAEVVELARYRELRAEHAACVQAVMQYQHLLDRADGTRPGRPPQT